jgi:RNA polymerase sigma-70 factor (ECF subfamily)
MSSISTSRLQPFPLDCRASSERASASAQVAQSKAQTDGALISRVRDGDREALALLFRRHARIVHGVVQRILRDRHEAEDIVQEVFLYVQRKASLFNDSKGSGLSWIVQVSYTQALLRRRRLKSQGFYASAIEDKSQESKFRSKSEAEYEQTVEGLFGRNGWREALEALTRDQRETLRLHFFEGYTFSEIAKKLEQSYVSIRHHHYRGLEKLRKHLTGNELTRR